MKTILLATVGTVLLAGHAAAASQYSVWGDDSGVTLHAPYQKAFESRTARSSDDTGLTSTFGLAPSADGVTGTDRRSNGGLVYKSEGDPGIVMHGRQDGYTIAR